MNSSVIESISKPVAQSDAPLVVSRRDESNTILQQRFQQYGYLYFKKRIDSALIVAPKSVYTVWKNEIQMHLPTEIDRSIFAWKVDKPKQYKKFLTEKNKLKFFGQCWSICLVLMVSLESARKKVL